MSETVARRPFKILPAGAHDELDQELHATRARSGTTVDEELGRLNQGAHNARKELAERRARS